MCRIQTPAARLFQRRISLAEQGAYDSFAMGNYPMASSYMGGTPDQPLPAFPMRAACRHLHGSFPDDASLLEVCPPINPTGVIFVSTLAVSITGTPTKGLRTATDQSY